MSFLINHAVKIIIIIVNIISNVIEIDTHGNQDIGFSGGLELPNGNINKEIIITNNAKNIDTLKG